jgi:2-hydroxychromene-2-carboxylate isomerase
MAKLEVFWDVGSPYTYLAVTQLPALAKRTGAEIVLVPFLLGGVFKGAGNTMPAAVPAKATYMMEDLKRWRDLYRVPLKIPPAEVIFPLNTLLPMRAAVAAKRAGKGDVYCNAIFAAYWGDGRDVSLPEVVEEVARSIGIDGAQLLKDAASQEVKDELRKNTEEATARGAFGAPAMFIGDELYWGNDRLDFVERRLLALAASR